MGMPETPERMFEPDPPMTLGVAGGVASGKSTVARRLAARGLAHLDADAEARRVLENPATLAAIRARFGAAVFGPAGAVDRMAIAEIVFQDPSALRDLEAITHPAVRAALLDRMREAHAAGMSVVLDVPLLFEGGLSEHCDACIFADAPIELRVARARERGWGDDELVRREANQLDPDEKRARCRYIVDTSGSLSETHAQVDAVLAQLARPE